MFCLGNFILLILLERVYFIERGELRFGNLINFVVCVYVII